MSADAPALSAPAGLAILRCPFCAAAEPVEEAALARQAHMIRCRQCGESWPARRGMAVPGKNGGQESRQLAIDAMRRPLIAYGEAGSDPWAARIVADEPRRPARRRPWLAALCGLAALSVPAGLLAGRETAVAAVPDLAGLYAAIGLPVHLTGVAIEAVEAERRIDGDGATIKVSGRLVNVGAQERPVPPLILQFRGAEGAVLYGTGTDAPVARLAPGQSERFVIEVERVPRQARQVLVRLGEAR